MQIIEETIRRQDVALLMDMEDHECRHTGGCKYVLAQLVGQIPDEQLRLLINQRYDSNTVVKNDLLLFVSQLLTAQEG